MELMRVGVEIPITSENHKAIWSRSIQPSDIGCILRELLITVELSQGDAFVADLDYALRNDEPAEGPVNEEGRMIRPQELKRD